MRLKPKTVRRLTLLAAVGCVLLIAAFSLVFVRKWQSQRMTEGFRAKALAAQQQRDYYLTIENAGSYLKRGDQRDPEVLLAYAEARLNLQEHDGRHLRDAAQFYQRYLEVRPDDAEARKTLLDTYNKCAFFPEAADLARSMRPSDLKEVGPEHIPILEQEALALVGAKRFESADQVINRLAELDPLNPYAALLRVDRVARADVSLRTLPDLLRWTNGFREKHPEEPVALVTAASAQMLTRNEGDLQEIRKWLARAAGVELSENGSIASSRPSGITSEVLATRLVEMLDRLRMQDVTLVLLRDITQRIDDPYLRSRLVRRLWQDSAFAEVLSRTEGLDPAKHDTDPELLGFRALSLLALGKESEAKAISDAMEARKGDYRLSSWAAALPLAQPEPSPDFKERVTTLKAIVKENPHEPVFQVWLGDSLTALARNDEALSAWKEATQTTEGSHWVLPRLRRAETLLRSSRLDEASEEATEAIRIAPNRAIVGVVFFEVQAARLQRGLSTTQSAEQLSLNVQKLDADLASLQQSESLAALRERLIAPTLIFMSRSQHRDHAIQYGQELLASDRPLSRNTIDRIALASAAERLGLEDACAKRMAGMKDGSATVQYSRALDLAASGRSTEGRALLEADVKARPGDIQARAALGRFLERIGDTKAALQVWRELGEKFPGDLAAQRSCLESGAIATDPEFLDATIKRYEQLAGIEPGGEDSTSKMARARALMHGTPSSRDRDRAVAMLASVIAQQPRLVEAKRLLASVLTYSDPARNIRPDFPRAIGALTEAITIESSNTTVALELATLLQLQGRFEAARGYLNGVAQEISNDLLLRRIAAEMLIRQGDFSPVADKTLEEIADRLGDQTPASVVVALASIYENRGRTAEAQEMYARLAGGLANDPESLYMTARHYSRAGNRELVDELLNKAAALPDASPATLDLFQARLAAERADVERAEAAFEAAAKADPKHADVWLQYSGMLVRRSDYDRAAQVAERGLREIPGERSLSVILEHATLLKEDSSDSEVAALSRALAATGGSADAKQILDAVRELKARGEVNNPDAIARLSDRFPRSVPLQMWAIERMIQINESRGIALLRRALAANPTDPGPAKFGAQLYLSRGQWNEMLSAATAWRDREGARTPEPDVAIAQAYLNMRQYDRGITAVARWLGPAIENPEQDFNLQVLNMHMLLKIGAGRNDEVFQELAPAFRRSTAARVQLGLVMAPAAMRDSKSAREWLSRVRETGEPESIEEDLALAMALSELAGRFPGDPTLFSDCKAILIRLSQRPDASGLVWESLGIVLHREGDLEGAAAAYRSAIALDSSRAGALNNLAVMTSERDLDAALELSQRAIAAGSPKSPHYPIHLDTLASIHRMRAKSLTGDEAADEYRAAARAYLDVSKLVQDRAPSLLEGAECARHAGEVEMAIDAYEQALRFRLDDTKVAQVRNNLASLRLKRLKPGDALKAREEALAAVQVLQDPRFLDTLGWANLACERPQEAESTFRKAIELPEASIASRIGLATVLLADAARTQEARAILAELDEAKLTPEEGRLLRQAREKLQAR